MHAGVAARHLIEQNALTLDGALAHESLAEGNAFRLAGREA